MTDQVTLITKVINKWKKVDEIVITKFEFQIIIGIYLVHLCTS